MILEHSNAAPYSVQQTHRFTAVILLELKEDPTYGAHLAHGILFLGQ